MFHRPESGGCTVGLAGAEEGLDSHAVGASTDASCGRTSGFDFHKTATAIVTARVIHNNNDDDHEDVTRRRRTRRKRRMEHN